ncbi:YbdD/YjiX family protein [Klebsiella pneumoniae]|uniref:YbdD/YjiX family protein n=1 Tax=Klebsiella pneumoniae TaxID=573 RepID=UPI001D1072CD|nr:YbdD/YjiX family protein [Klebsiella pneumoniae]
MRPPGLRSFLAGGKMMIGVPDYDNYVEHMRITHPDQTPMTYEEFFRERQDARYGGKGGAKCC